MKVLAIATLIFLIAMGCLAVFVLAQLALFAARMEDEGLSMDEHEGMCDE